MPGVRASGLVRWPATVHALVGAFRRHVDALCEMAANFDMKRGYAVVNFTPLPMLRTFL